MTSPRTRATATSKDGLDLCRAYFFRVWRKEIKEALLAGWSNCYCNKIEESLGLITPIVIDVNPDRKNIHFSTLCSGNQGGERLVNILDPLLKDLRDKRLTIIYGNLETIANCFFYFTSKFGIEQYEPVGAPKRARNRLFSQYHAQYHEHERQRIILCRSIIVDELVQDKSKLRIIFGNGLDKSSTRQVIHIGGRTLWKNISKKLVEQGEMGCQRELICFLRATACDKPQKIKIALLLHTGRL